MASSILPKAHKLQRSTICSVDLCCAPVYLKNLEHRTVSVWGYSHNGLDPY